MKRIYQTLIGFAMVIVLMSFHPIQNLGHLQQSVPWVAPKTADTIHNPLKSNATATADGKVLFTQACVVCHGEKGKGDGVAGVNLSPHPANLTSTKVQSQTDGALFWKMTNGRAPMASYKAIYTDKQRWELVDYIREMGKQAGTSK